MKTTKRLSKETEQEVVRLYTTRAKDGTWIGNVTIGRIVGISSTSVQNILIRNGIKTRDAVESHSGGKKCKPIVNVPPIGENPPMCKCGCLNPVEWNQRKKRWNVYFVGHQFPELPCDNKDWIYNEYVTLQKTTSDIAKQLGVSTTKICNSLKENGIKRRLAKVSLRISGKTRGDKNPAWKGGVAKWDYSSDWKSICKDIKDRDKWTCQSCKEQRKHWGYNLHVHHRDGNKFNNFPGNLISLCSKCHRLVHANKIKI